MRHHNIINNIINKNIIFINDLTINITIGEEIWEREIKKSIIINISIAKIFQSLNPTNNQKDLDLNLDLNHKSIINLIINFCAINTFLTLDSIVIELEKLIISKYSTNILSLQIDVKQLFPATNVKEIGVTIARDYTNTNS